MGANQSNGVDESREEARRHNPPRKGHNHSPAPGSSYHHGMLDKQRKAKAKPNPPFRIKFVDVTHNSITLSWHPSLGVDGHSIIAYTVEIVAIRPGKESHWRSLTKCCQGTTYEARYLEPDTDYVFRIRAENIFGVGKPSNPSEICTTKMFETFPTELRSRGVSNYSKCLDESSQNMRRHYSFNMHIAGGVKSILSHSEINIKSSAASSRSCISASDRSKKPQTFLRSDILRTSLPSSRKISAPLLLPGTRYNSLNRLRDSCKSVRTDTLDSKHRTTRDSGISGLRGSLTVFDCHSIDSQVSEDDCDRKNHDLRSRLLPSDPLGPCANSVDGDSGKGSKMSLCDSVKVSDTQSITDSAVADLAVSDHTGSIRARKYGAVQRNSSSIDSCESIHTLGNDENIDTHRTISLGNKNIDIHRADPLVHLDKNTINKTNLLRSFGQNTTMYNSKEELKARDLTDGKCKIYKPGDQDKEFSDTRDPQKQEYYETLDNPWQKDTSASDVSKQILAAPVSDDVKMALYSKAIPSDQCFTTGNSLSVTKSITKEARDFRTLRSVLQSSNVIVKNSRSLPDVVAIVSVNGETKSIIKGKLTTILDMNEDDDTVRVTTL